MARVQWNEANLAEIEANKPERQKITEPKTPYHPMIEDDEDEDSSSASRRGSFGNYFEEDAMNIEGTSSSLSDAGSSSKTVSHHTGWTTSDDEADTMDQGEEDSDSERRRSFKEHRKDHYNEFIKIKEMRDNGSSYVEDASDDDSAITAGVKDIDIKKSSLSANGS